MLGSIRNFSKTIYAKILLGIVIIPFVFWGMGSSLSGGNKNIIVIIDNDKYSINEFGDFIQRNSNEKVTSNQIENLLSVFISEKLIEKEIEYFDIYLSEKSLADLLKNQKKFKRDGKFSRTEYEKFLIENNVTAVTFESFLAKEEKKKQLLNFVSGGLMPAEFIVNNSYDKINQKRSIKLISLEDSFQNELTFSDKKINEYFEKNKIDYTKIYKSFKLIELSPETLADGNEYTDLFFKRIDEIDDLIIQGNNLSDLINKFSLNNPQIYKIDINGKNFDQTAENIIFKDIAQKLFTIDPSDPTMLVEKENKYFLIELSQTENVQLNLLNKSVKNNILKKLKADKKREMISKIISEINANKFNKVEFDKFAAEKNSKVQEVKLQSQNDDKIIKKEIINQIYSWPEKKVIVVNKIDLSESYLVYIDKIEHVKLKFNSDEYKNYQNLTEAQLINSLYNTYDTYIKQKYKIDINYQTLETVKNYYN